MAFAWSVFRYVSKGIYMVFYSFFFSENQSQVPLYPHSDINNFFTSILTKFPAPSDFCRFKSLMRPPRRRVLWLPEQDQLLLRIVGKYGTYNWVHISQYIHCRSPKQCRERFHQSLKPSLNRAPISAEEGLTIERLVNERGKRWAEIARRLGNRSDNTVKNWWNGSINRKRGGLSTRTTSRSHSNRNDTPDTHTLTISPYCSHITTSSCQSWANSVNPAISEQLTDNSRGSIATHQLPSINPPIEAPSTSPVPLQVHGRTPRNLPSIDSCCNSACSSLPSTILSLQFLPPPFDLPSQHESKRAGLDMTVSFIQLPSFLLQSYFWDLILAMDGWPVCPRSMAPEN